MPRVACHELTLYYTFWVRPYATVSKTIARLSRELGRSKGLERDLNRICQDLTP